MHSWKKVMLTFSIQRNKPKDLFWVGHRINAWDLLEKYLFLRLFIRLKLARKYIFKSWLFICDSNLLKRIFNTPGGKRFLKSFWILILSIFRGKTNIVVTKSKRNFKSTVWVSPHGVMDKAIDCKIVVSEFELQSRYYVHFRTNILGKGKKTPYPAIYGLISTPTVLLGG